MSVEAGEKVMNNIDDLIQAVEEEVSLKNENEEKKNQDEAREEELKDNEP